MTKIFSFEVCTGSTSAMFSLIASSKTDKSKESQKNWSKNREKLAIMPFSNKLHWNKFK